MGEMDESYEDVVDDIYALQKSLGRMSLQPIIDMMQQLDDPHTAFRSVHIAGTNGKGSTTRILAAMLEEAGYTVGTYTSPHLMDFRERVRVNGDPIPPDRVATYYQEIAEQDIDLSFFEFTTALAFMHFAEEDIDIAVIEAGIGGRLDATNIITPDVSVITNVSEDHENWLGETPEQIAYEKAGIIKEQTPIVCGASGSPRNVIEEVAAEQDAPLHVVEDRIDAERQEESAGLTVTVADKTFETDIIADYQVDNINTAMTACDLIKDYAVASDDMQRALAMLEIDGRMERIADHPLVLLDGAHNPSGMRQAAQTIEELQQGKTITVTSIMGDKNYASMMDEIESFADLILVSEADIDRAAEPDDLADCITDTDYEVEPEIRETVRKALELASAEDTIVFTGSLYFIGDVKWTIEQMKW
jgi:dihydrofolate synthase/folylpolyglutamate synthase